MPKWNELSPETRIQIGLVLPLMIVLLTAQAWFLKQSYDTRTEFDEAVQASHKELETRSHDLELTMQGRFDKYVTTELFTTRMNAQEKQLDAQARQLDYLVHRIDQMEQHK